MLISMAIQLLGGRGSCLFPNDFESIFSIYRSTFPFERIVLYTIRLVPQHRVMVNELVWLNITTEASHEQYNTKPSLSPLLRAYVKNI